MRIVLISLPDSTERREEATRQFNAAGLEFEFFDGIDGRKPGPPLFESVDLDAYAIQTGRAPRPGEIGCMASHRAVWQYCVDLNEPLIILEDDSFLEAGFPDAVKLVERWIGQYGFIRLQDLRDEPYKVVEQENDFRLVYCYKFPHGAVGYALNPDVARAFVAQTETLTAPSDKFIKNFWQHGQPLYCLLPGTIRPGELNDISTIGGRDKVTVPPLLKLRRAFAKLIWGIKRRSFHSRNAP